MTLNRYTIDGEEFAVFRDRLYRKTGETRNPRVIATADCVLNSECKDAWQNELLQVGYHGANVQLYHYRGGEVATFPASEWRETAYETFEEVEE
jgi:hypothetical protein